MSLTISHCFQGIRGKTIGTRKTGLPMTETSYIDDLKKAREALVSARRQHAKTAAGQPAHMVTQEGLTIERLQTAIEAVDRAIADEDKMLTEGASAQST